LANVVEEGGIGRIERAGKHEVMPNEEAELIAQTVELIALVFTT